MILEESRLRIAEIQDGKPHRAIASLRPESRSQPAFLQASGAEFERRVEHGPTRGLYIRDPNGYSVELLYQLPREIWEGDLTAAINHYVTLPTEGSEALVDRTDGYPVFADDRGAIQAFPITLPPRTIWEG
jgi:hypothetical protein